MPICDLCVTHSRPQSPRSFWPVAGLESSGPDFLSMRRAFVSCSRPIRFDEKSVNRGLPVLDQARALEPCHRPEGSWALGTRMCVTKREVYDMRAYFGSTTCFQACFRATMWGTLRGRLGVL